MKSEQYKEKLESIYETSFSKLNFHYKTVRSNLVSFKCNFMLLREDMEYFTFRNFSRILFLAFVVSFTHLLVQVKIVSLRNSVVKVRHLECQLRLHIISSGCTKVGNGTPETNPRCKHSRILNRVRPRTV